MKAVAERPGQTLVVADEAKPGDVRLKGRIMQGDGTLGPEMNFQTLLAQGYWREVTPYAVKEWDPEKHPRDDHGRFAEGDLPSGLPGDSYDGWYNREEDIRRNSTEEEYDAWANYTNASGDINGLLRKGNDADLRGGTRQEVRAKIRAIDSLMKRQPPLKTDQVLYRRGDIGDVQPGDVIQDKGFVSTSTQEDSLTPFHGRDMVIEVPKGTRVLIGESMEREVILPRGKEYAVTKVEMYKDPKYADVPKRIYMRMK